MRILMIQDSWGGGGAETIFRHWRRGLQVAGHEVAVLSRTPSPEVEFSFRSHSGRVELLLRLFNPWAFSALRRALREFRPEVAHVGIFSFRLSPAIFALLREIPTLYYAQLHELDCPTGKRWVNGSVCFSPAGNVCLQRCLSFPAWLALMLQQRLQRSALGAVGHGAACSQHLRDRLQSRGIRVDSVLRPGLPQPSRVSVERRPQVACAARLEPEKGVDVLLRAFARLRQHHPEAELLLAGEGSSQASLRALAAQLELGDSVRWLGWLQGSELQARFARARFQVVPSLWEEPYGLVACEAAALGLPALVSGLGGLREIVVPGETGLWVSPGSVSALAEAMLRLWDSPPLAAEMGYKARLRAEQEFCLERSLRDLLSCYQRLATMEKEPE